MLKGVTSGKAPPENCQHSWNEMVFRVRYAKKQRGKKPISSKDIIPYVITWRHCVSKVAEIFDLTGNITGNLKFKRAIVPDNAVNLNTKTLDFGDTSKILCWCCDLRSIPQERRDLLVSVSIFLLQALDGTSQSPAELSAAII